MLRNCDKCRVENKNSDYCIMLRKSGDKWCGWRIPIYEGM